MRSAESSGAIQVVIPGNLGQSADLTDEQVRIAMAKGRLNGMAGQGIQAGMMIAENGLPALESVPIDEPVVASITFTRPVDSTTHWRQRLLFDPDRY